MAVSNQEWLAPGLANSPGGQPCSGEMSAGASPVDLLVLLAQIFNEMGHLPSADPSDDLDELLKGIGGAVAAIGGALHAIGAAAEDPSLSGIGLLIETYGKLIQEKGAAWMTELPADALDPLFEVIFGLLPLGPLPGGSPDPGAQPDVGNIDLSGGSAGQSMNDGLFATLEQMLQQVYGALLMQTRLKPYMDAIELVIDDSGIRFDAGGIDTLLARRAQDDALAAVADLVALRRHGSEMLAVTDWSFPRSVDTLLSGLTLTPDVEALLATEKIAWMGVDGTRFRANASQAGFLVVGNALNNRITGHAAGADHLYGGAGRDRLTAMGCGDVLEGGEGNDVLVGNRRGTANTTFIGGRGNDTLIGGVHADTYLYNRGDGTDTITDKGGTGCPPPAGDTSDTLLFGPDISKEDLWLMRNGRDLDVQVLGENPGQVTIRDWYAGDRHKIEQFQLSDGQKLAYKQVDLLVQAMAGIAPPTMGQTTLSAEQQTALSPLLASVWG